MSLPLAVVILAIIGLVRCAIVGYGLCREWGIWSKSTVHNSSHPTLGVISDLLMIVETICVVGMLASCIACLSVASAARRSMIVFAFASLILAVVGYVMMIGYVFPHLDNELVWNGPYGNTPPTAESALMWVKIIMLACTTFDVAYLASALYIMTRPHVKQFFARRRQMEAIGQAGQ
jgi:hypothetical protein